MILNARDLDMLMNGNLIGDMPGMISRPGILGGFNPIKGALLYDHCC
jgi:hypothetical protein